MNVLHAIIVAKQCSILHTCNGY